jgi:hypothetical protein
MRRSLFAVRALDSFVSSFQHTSILLSYLQDTPRGLFPFNFIHGYPEINTNYLILQIGVRMAAMSVMDTATTLWHEDLHQILFRLESLYQERTPTSPPCLLFKTTIHPDKKTWHKAEIQKIWHAHYELFSLIHADNYNPLPPRPSSNNEKPQA